MPPPTDRKGVEWILHVRVGALNYVAKIVPDYPTHPGASLNRPHSLSGKGSERRSGHY